MTSHAEAKASIRTSLRAELKALPSEVRAAASVELCARAKDSVAWKNARAVLLFFPLPSEPDISALLAEALTEGKLLALPRFNLTTAAYEPVRITDPARELVVGPYQVREPVAGCPVVAMNRLDLALVPGLAFDARGHRLGRGKGFYDRLLAGFPGRTVGVAFDFQVVAQVPVEPHDIALNAVVTPTRWLEAKAS